MEFKGVISGLIKSKMVASHYLGNFWMHISPQQVIL